MKYIDGGICAPKGYKASGIHCGIRKNKSKRDLALIVSDVPASAACVYTTNLVKGAPIAVTKKHVENGIAKAIICNSGNANTCNADGIEIANGICKIAEKASGIKSEDFIIASTGVIGQQLSLAPFENGMEELFSKLGEDCSEHAAEAIMTTDTVKKEIAIQFEIDGKICKIGGIAKGSGMIHPNMATMLVFITCDVCISHEMLQKALSDDIQDTFNMISIDGDTSTNDMVSILCNGMAENKMISTEGNEFEIFKHALNALTTELCKAIAKDGEGATKLLVCSVHGADNKENGKLIAKSVICSSLFKAAMFGADANWGRVLCAIGYSSAKVDIGKIDVSFSSPKGTICVCENGAGIDFSEEKAKEILLQDEITIQINLKAGNSSAEAFGCDLTYDYVKINGDYRT